MTSAGSISIAGGLGKRNNLTPNWIFSTKVLPYHPGNQWSTNILAEIEKLETSILHGINLKERKQALGDVQKRFYFQLQHQDGRIQALEADLRASR
jgi:hypothetical protein